MNWTEGCPPHSPHDTNGILRKFCVQTTRFEHDVVYSCRSHVSDWNSEVRHEKYLNSEIIRYIEVTTPVDENGKKML